MFTKPFAILIATVAAVSVSGLSVNTPTELTQCGAVEIKWSGKNSPFILSVLPSCESDSEDPLMEFTSVNATSYKWTVNLPSSTGPIAFAVTDRDGNEAYTDEVAIKKSDDGTCLSAASSSAAATSVAAATSATSVSDANSPTPTTLAVSDTPIPSVPINAGAGLNSGSGSGSEGSSSSSSEAQTQVNSAVSPGPTFASMIGVAAALFALL
ncbi:unnamed protein product [Rhizoctonia solani]|uniref:GPI anchored protein n=1 Tax=Rhizoctonia solani TaxID=456999 RepID=A0A8H3D1Z4_9AGAM|nr:unnamed protein product [Rhizoctonia solani]